MAASAGMRRGDRTLAPAEDANVAATDGGRRERETDPRGVGRLPARRFARKRSSACTARPREPGRRRPARRARRGPRLGRVTLTDGIRAASARVAAKARHVGIEEDAIEAYARSIPAQSPPAPDLEGADDETRA